MDQQITSEPQSFKGQLGGYRPGTGTKAGEVRGPYSKNNLQKLRLMAQEYTERALKRIVEIMESPDSHPTVVLAAAGMILDRGHGKAREYVTIESNETLTIEYESIEEARAKLIADGFPIDRLEQPKLIEHSADDHK